MNPIRFTPTVEDRQHLHLPGDHLAVTVHWPGLYEEWPDGARPWTEYAVSNSPSEEAAVYLTDQLSAMCADLEHRIEESGVSSLPDMPSFLAAMARLVFG